MNILFSLNPIYSPQILLMTNLHFQDKQSKKCSGEAVRETSVAGDIALLAAGCWVLYV